MHIVFGARQHLGQPSCVLKDLPRVIKCLSENGDAGKQGSEPTRFSVSPENEPFQLQKLGHFRKGFKVGVEFLLVRNKEGGATKESDRDFRKL